MSQDHSAESAARAALGLGPQDGLGAVEAAFRRRVGPLARAATGDPEASLRLRALIEARAHLRATLTETPLHAQPPPRARAEPAPPPPAAPQLAALGFRLAADGREVEVDLSLEALVAAASGGATSATLAAPVFRRCPSCTRRGHAACGRCGGRGVVATAQTRIVPLDLARLADDDFAIEASPWSDAHGRGARGGPLFRARLI